VAITLTVGKTGSPATRRVTGTTLASRSAIPVPSDALQEYGSSRGSFLPDVVPELANRALAIRTYNKMVRTDVSCRISLRAGKAPVLGGQYYIQPYDETEQSAQIAEFAAENIFLAPSRPWLLALQDIMKMLDYGFAVMEPVFELREWAPKRTTPGANRKQYTMIRKLAPRPANTISLFEYDNNGGPSQVTQQAIQADNSVVEKKLGIEKLLVFTFEGEGVNLEGQSVLRSAYEHWYYKQQLYKIDAIQKERHGIGVPDIELPAGYSANDKRIAHILGRNLRTNEYAYIVRPPGFKVGFAELKSVLTNALESATHHDLQIMKNILIQFIDPNASGSRAGGVVSIDIFMKSMRYIASMVCSYVNQFLMPQIVGYNFDTDQFPTLSVRNIGEVKDIQMWAAAVSNLVNQNAITVDDDTEQYIRDVMQFPQKLGKRPLAADSVSNVKEQYLLKDLPDTVANEDLTGEAALLNAKSKTGNGATGTGVTTGTINQTHNGA
jgi:hypothetical protein